jgi:phospholipase/carboxylesterase
MITVTLNMGMKMRAWYDILDLDLDRRHDEEGIRKSATQIEALIQREKDRGIPSNRIILAGFSQGGAIALHVGLRHEEPLAGVMALSTYLVCEETIEAECSKANGDVPIFQAHGSSDPMVTPDRGEAARARLTELGHDVEWRTYPMPHSVCDEEIVDIATWIRSRFTVS